MKNEITICKYNRKPEKTVQMVKEIIPKENKDLAKALQEIISFKDNSLIFKQQGLDFKKNQSI